VQFVERKYLSLVSPRLRNYKNKSDSVVNFSCCFCGDSETKKRKARGYIYTRDGKTLYSCHNCGLTCGFDKFLERLDINLYEEFRRERAMDRMTSTQMSTIDLAAAMKKPVFRKSGPLKDLKKISQLDPNHPCKRYVDSRRIPPERHHELFWCPRFYEWSNSVVPDKFEEAALRKDHGRLLIPFFDKQKNMHAFQGRALPGQDDLKYITIIVDETVPKLYGLHLVDFTKRFYVLEGPIDSFFVPNSVATAGGDLASVIPKEHRQNAVIVYDNERRSRQTIKKIDKAIDLGYSCILWPDTWMLPHLKDINDAILAGWTDEQLKACMKAFTYSGLEAKARLSRWRMV